MIMLGKAAACVHRDRSWAQNWEHADKHPRYAHSTLCILMPCTCMCLAHAVGLTVPTVCQGVHSSNAVLSRNWLKCREGSWTEQDAIAVGVEAGKELKQQAGDEFFDWARQNVY